AVADLLARDLDRSGEIAREDQLGERAGAGDVGPLADVDEQRIVANRQRLEAGEAHRTRHRQARSRLRGAALTAAAIWRMCSGVVPQQPPTMLTKPLRAKSPRSRAVVSGASS